MLLVEMLRAYKYRLYPSADQRALLAKHFGCCRWVYNWALDLKTKSWQESKKRLSSYDLITMLPGLKKSPETEWLREVNSQALQQSVIHLELAFDKFFKEKKGYPKFKSKRDHHQSFSCPQGVDVDFKTGTIYLPKLDWVQVVLSRTFIGKIKTVTVSRTPTGKYFASVLVDDGKDLPAKKKYSDKTTVGIDLGLTHFATLSTGEKIANPRPLKQNLVRLKREQRRLSRKQKGSKNREKQRMKVALVHERVTNIRKDFLHKLSTRLVRENKALAFETLNIKGMSASARGTAADPGRNVKQKAGLNRSILDAAWGMFGTFCTYKLEWAGGWKLQIGQWRPSTIKSLCGYVNRELKLSDRIWTCPQCGRTYDRDIHAAQNIKQWALHPENFIPQDMRDFKLVEIGYG